MAPELLTAKPVTVKADVYSYAMILWEMLTRQQPFHGLSTFKVSLDYQIYLFQDTFIHILKLQKSPHNSNRLGPGKKFECESSTYPMFT